MNRRRAVHDVHRSFALAAPDAGGKIRFDLKIPAKTSTFGFCAPSHA
jgi:hypothetical protein